jgi:hypothetical protein
MTMKAAPFIVATAALSVATPALAQPAIQPSDVMSIAQEADIKFVQDPLGRGEG